MKILFCGDPHVKKDNIEQSRKLISWLKDLSDERECVIVFAGDQYNDFGVARVEVMNFWTWAYRALGGTTSYSLIGNHDMNPDATASAMIAHEEQTILVGTIPVIIDAKNRVDAIGFIRDFEQFKTKVMESYNKGCRFMICHAEFDGAQFENGFYSPHGFDGGAFPEDLVFVSGHIHKRQNLIDKKTGKVRVIYPGTPRMLTRSDIGQEKSVMIWDTATGEMEYIEVPESVCPRFQHFVVTPENLATIEKIPDSPMVYVDLQGPKEFIQKAAKKVGDSVKLRTLPDPDERKKVTIKESDGIPLAFAKYSKTYLEGASLEPEHIDAILKMVYDKVPELKS